MQRTDRRLRFGIIATALFDSRAERRLPAAQRRCPHRLERGFLAALRAGIIGAVRAPCPSGALAGKAIGARGKRPVFGLYLAQLRGGFGIIEADV